MAFHTYARPRACHSLPSLHCVYHACPAGGSNLPTAHIGHDAPPLVLCTCSYGPQVHEDALDLVRKEVRKCPPEGGSGWGWWRHGGFNTVGEKAGLVLS